MGSCASQIFHASLTGVCRALLAPRFAARNFRLQTELPLLPVSIALLIHTCGPTIDVPPTAPQERMRLQRALRVVPSFGTWQVVARQLEASEQREELVAMASSPLPWRRRAAKQQLLQANNPPVPPAPRASQFLPSGRNGGGGVSDEEEEEEVEQWAMGGGRLQYDRELVEERLRLLVQSRASGDVGEMMFALRADLLRNLGNVTNIGRRLHEPEHRSMPRPVREYIDEVCLQLRLVASERELLPEEKLAFLQETRHCFGRTALLLSGGGTLGAFHIGVVRALARLLPLLPPKIPARLLPTVCCEQPHAHCPVTATHCQLPMLAAVPRAAEQPAPSRQPR